MLVLFLMAEIGFVGFLDDWTKIQHERSLGLHSAEKLIGQTVVAVIFAVLATTSSRGGITPASYRISFVRDTWFDLAFHGTVIGLILFVLWANLMITGASNGVNLTDGLDGQAAGACVMVFGAYVLISVWQFNQNCRVVNSTSCYNVRDPLDLAAVAACVMGACFGFLWWNSAPAKIIMGDTGSLGLGGALAGLAIMTRTEFVDDHSRWALRARDARLGADHRHDPLLDHLRGVRYGGPRGVLRRMGRRRRVNPAVRAGQASPSISHNLVVVCQFRIVIDL